MGALRSGERAMSRGDFAAAAGLLALHVADRPGDSRARLRLGQALFESGREKDGLREAGRAAAELGDGNPAGLIYALMLAESGSADKAADLTAKVKASDPENPFAAGIEALLLLKAGDAAGAAGVFESRGVFESPVFRARLLARIEDFILQAEKGKTWGEGYLKTVL